jgi:putative DNA primase/helicase
MAMPETLEGSNSQTPPDANPAAFFERSQDNETTRLLMETPVTEMDNANLFAILFNRELAFAEGLGWLRYDGSRWLDGEESQSYALRQAMRLLQLRIETFRRSGAPVENAPVALTRLASFSNNSSLQSLLGLAARLLLVDATKFDADIYLLNTANGALNLKTGILLKHSPEQYLTRCTGVRYVADAKSELWENTVKEIACGDAELIAYFQKIAGYACSGDVSAQCLFYFLGNGANGKSLLTSLWAEALGGFGRHGYAVRLNYATVLGRRERNPESPSPDMLSLRGKRLAVFSEPDDDKPINSGRLKDLTGGDNLTARALFKPPITFAPTHTLIGNGNHILTVAESDHGIWRRMRIVPFKARFKPSRRYEELSQPRELEAILAWMVEGAMQLRREGWHTPRVVEDASRQYRNESNPLQVWIEEDCELGGEAPSSALYQSYDAWCAENREPRISNSLFTRRMQQAGFQKRRSNSQTLLQGIRPRGEDLI